MKVKKWLNAQELADYRLKSLPSTKAGVIYRAKKDCWINRKRSGRGGGTEYAFDDLPKDVQAEIKAKTYKALMPKKSTDATRQVALIANRDLSKLDDAQRATADARLQMTLLVGQYQASLGSRNKALDAVVALSRDEALPIDELTDYNAICATAMAKRLSKAGVGKRILHEWCTKADQCSTPTERLAALAPQKQGQPVIIPTNIEWLADFLAVYCQPKGLPVSEAYRIFVKEYDDKHGTGAAPHYDAVRRALSKLPIWVRETGRLTGSAMRGLRAYVRRDWNADWMRANDMWVGDGHSLKMKARHPQDGSPTTPELTIIMDATSRMIVGWSLAYSESQIAVGDALRHGMQNHGIPAIYYSDNGGGQKNKTFDTDVTGVFARLGVHHATGIPGNPQGRGIIERQMKEVPKRVAQAFATYTGKDADPETVRKMLSDMGALTDAVAKHKSSDELTPKQKRAERMLPSWHELMAEIKAQVEDYNFNRIHSVIGTTPAKKREQLLMKMDEGDFIPLSAEAARDLFRPSFERTVDRGQVRWDNDFYADPELEFHAGKKVMVFIDQHDPSSVIVRDLDGRWICEAKLDAFAQPAFPKSFVEKKREKSVQAQIKRKTDDIAAIKSKNRTVIEHEKADVLRELFSGKTVETIATQEYPMFACDVKTVNKK
ncbi:MAG: Mu transposase C-terminal domain-containing protein [Psychrobacter sp.]|nr:Mu transposase C-terminal domain-containing protein [Psychrobacter sp.]